MRLNAIQTLIILLAITVGTVITRFRSPTASRCPSSCRSCVPCCLRP